jgi:hypothetical protein
VNQIRALSKRPAIVLVNLLRQTEATEGRAAVLEQLHLVQRTTTINITKIVSVRGRIILQRCNELAVSTWHILGSCAVDGEHMLVGMRRIAGLRESKTQELTKVESRNSSKKGRSGRTESFTQVTGKFLLSTAWKIWYWPNRLLPIAVTLMSTCRLLTQLYR